MLSGRVLEDARRFFWHAVGFLKAYDFQATAFSRTSLLRHWFAAGLASIICPAALRHDNPELTGLTSQA